MNETRFQRDRPTSSHTHKTPRNNNSVALPRRASRSMHSSGFYLICATVSHAITQKYIRPTTMHFQLFNPINIQVGCARFSRIKKLRAPGALKIQFQHNRRLLFHSMCQAFLRTYTNIVIVFQRKMQTMHFYGFPNVHKCFCRKL